MKTFDSLTEQEILALAISLEEEDARVYEDFAAGLEESYPEQAEKFRIMRREEDGHRHRLLELYKARFGDHVPFQRHMIAETAFVKFEQAVAVAVLFAAHDAEFLGLFGIIFLQAGGEILIDARVLLLERDGQREDFLFGKAVKGFHT